ncbi:exodeoxyribonuclease III [Candidatus Gracilibacteria bacterium]|nr:exodeoxyribonuclease III [Candidatus Gracilibacteria bacterium]MCF7819118.1 exodeoxyribonuclease III [Candidatus Gracilibacteria bacterium]
MKIASWNVNGIRAVERKGALDEFLQKYDPDVFLIQEIKARKDQLSRELIAHPEYQQFYHSAVKPGYAGTGIWAKKQVSNSEFHVGMPDFDDDEGRISRIEIGEWTIFGVYFPNGGKSPEAWKGKLVFYEKFLAYVNEFRSEGRKVVWAGDVNCAHEEIDIARPKENENSIGFLPQERDWISKAIANDWVDAFREIYPEKIVYSWWHVISRARERNVGWRIDYFFIDKKYFSRVKEISYLNQQMGSDHCPVMIKIETD